MTDAARDGEKGPTQDWGRDLDIFDPRFVVDPAPVWQELRNHCPVAYTERRGRAWMPVDYEVVARVADDPATFSSRRVGVVDRSAPVGDGSPLVTAPPITSDPPVHTWARRVLLPAFAPSRIEQLTDVTRTIARDLLTAVTSPARGSADAAKEYAQHIPVRVIAHMLGVPAADEELFTGWVVRILQEGFTNLEGGAEAIDETLRYFDQQVVDRIALAPGERPRDLITDLLETEVDGQPIDRGHLLGTCFLILVAGIDTTWSAIGASLWHLACHPEDQERLRADPGLLSMAVEEFLRFYSPVTMAREVTSDVDVAGCPMRSGDKVLLSFPAANRDPSHFERPDTFVIDRARNRHVAFGKGIHRCLGSNLARMELSVALQEWLERVPPFELADAATVTWTGGQVRGPRSVPVRWGR